MVRDYQRRRMEAIKKECKREGGREGNNTYLAGARDRGLLLPDGGGGLETHPDDDRLAVGDPTLDAPRAIGAGPGAAWGREGGRAGGREGRREKGLAGTLQF